MRSTQITSPADIVRLHQLQVRQSNVITSGRFDFSQCQLDILFFLLANFNEHEDTYLIHCRDMELITGRQWKYEQFKKSTEEMLGRVFVIKDEKERTYTQLVLFQYFKYYEGKGTIEIKISEPSKPLFFDLKANFTYLELKSVLSLTSKYAKRIYALCCQWRAVGFKEYSLKEFKEMLGLIDLKTGKEQFAQITPFKEKILELSKNQINRNTDIRFDYKLEKKMYSRSFNSITIYINQPAPEQLKLELEQADIDFNQSIEYQKNIKTIMAYGLSEKQANEILENGSIEQFEQVIEDTKKAVVKNKIDNHIAYLCGTLKNKKLL